MAFKQRTGADFVDTDIVQQHIESAAVYAAQQKAADCRQFTNSFLRHDTDLIFDSPLEVLFWVWWTSTIEGCPGSDLFTLHHQYDTVVKGKNYRVDFLLEPHSQPADWRPIAIELDGHAFHERTPEQVAIRDRRDRDLQEAGWHIFHFSFREFTNAPINAVAEVFCYARRCLRPEQWGGARQ